MENNDHGVLLSEPLNAVWQSIMSAWLQNNVWSQVCDELVLGLGRHLLCHARISLCVYDRRRGKTLNGCFAVCWHHWRMLCSTLGRCLRLFPSSTLKPASVHTVHWSRISLPVCCRLCHLVRDLYISLSTPVVIQPILWIQQLSL